MSLPTKHVIKFKGLSKFRESKSKLLRMILKMRESDVIEVRTSRSWCQLWQKIILLSSAQWEISQLNRAKRHQVCPVVAYLWQRLTSIKQPSLVRLLVPFADVPCLSIPLAVIKALMPIQRGLVRLISHHSIKSSWTRQCNALYNSFLRIDSNLIILRNQKCWKALCRNNHNRSSSGEVQPKATSSNK